MQFGNRNNQHSFAQIPSVNIPRSSFDRSYEIKDTYEFDIIYPFHVDEVMPGDTFNVSANIFARLATQIKPVMDRMYASYEFFFVPSRLLWTNFKKQMGEQINPGDSTDYLTPQIELGVSDVEVGSIYDKMGIPTDVTGLKFNALPLRAYSLIYNTWYRDENLIDSLVIPDGDGPDAKTDYSLQKRAKAHDYFTSALPWPQKHDPVSLPLGQWSEVVPMIAVNPDYAGQTFNTVQKGSPGTDLVGNLESDALGKLNNGADLGWIHPNGQWAADLANATSATINQFREAMLMQSLFELDARGGTRFPEVIKAHFNTVLPDFTAQRPEYLCGGHFDINVHPVAQNSQSGTTPQGNLAAFATHMVSGKSLGFTKSFNEWGYVLGMVTFRAALTYQQGLNRMWSRQTRYDHYWPKLQGLGEQEILNKEIFAQGTADDDKVFGYQERYAEYRYKPSEIRGAFRSTYATSLDVWHLAEEFGTLPTLSQDFIESNTPIDRVVVNTDEPKIIFNAYMKQICARPMLTYSVPVSLGRF